MQKRISLLRIGLLFALSIPSVLFSTTSTVDSTRIQYGDSITGSISVANEQDYYTFSGDSGDVVLIRSTESSNGFQLNMELFDPDGISLSSESNNLVTELRIVLSGSGTHVILVSDTHGSLTRGYGLFLQKLNGASGSVALDYGESVAGEINPLGEVDTYTFSGDSGDVVLIRSTESSNGF